MERMTGMMRRAASTTEQSMSRLKQLLEDGSVLKASRI
jgi:hypothetical protein